MSFIDCQPDLTGTIFSTKDLEIAREVLTDFVKRHDSTWLDRPRGSLGALWMREDTDAVCRLVAIANLLWFLRQPQTLTPGSLAVLEHKFNKELFHHKDKQFDETLTELQIAGALADFATPLELEPLVPKDENRNQGNKPRSPDFGIRLPGGDIHIDATVFHLRVLDKWDNSMQMIRDAISKAVHKRGLLRSVDLRFPLASECSDIQKLLPKLVNKITKEETGVEEFIIAGRKSRVKWQPVLSAPWTAHNLANLPFSLEQLLETPAVVVGSPISTTHFAWDLLEKEQDNDDEEVLFTSLCNKLKGKRDQFPEKRQNLIAVKLGHHKLVSEAFLHMLQTKMWANKDFRFLTGLILFKPRQGYQKSDPGNLMELSVNPGAYVPASQALISMFEKQERYHSEPGNALAHNNRGAAYESQGDIENAIKSYKKSLALDSEQSAIHNIVGILLAGRGDLQGAISAFHEALRCDSEFAEAYRNLGIAYRCNGDNDDAISAFKKSIALNPDKPEALYSLGITYALIENHTEAISMYEKAIAINPKYAQAYVNMGISQARLGKMDAAVTSFEKVLQFDPASEKAQQYLTQAKQCLAAKKID